MESFSSVNMRRTYLAFGTPDYTDEEIDAVARVMRSGWVGMGPETLAFEKELAEYIGVQQMVAVNSCTAALFLALLVEGVGAGDEVIVPSLTWCSTINAALYLGATPVFCDVDLKNMCVSPATVAAKLSPRTKAVIVVHYGGYAVDVDALREALPPTVAIIEDAAHAFGSMHANGKRVGASGNLVCFSFYANKNLSTAEGGAIAVFHAEKADRLRRLSMNGMNSNAWSRYIKPLSALTGALTELGYKMNYTDLQAAIGRVQLKRFEQMQKIRFELVQSYRRLLVDAQLSLTFQEDVFTQKHAHHLFLVIFENFKEGMDRNKLLLDLHARNIGAAIHYAPLHQAHIYRSYADGKLPVTEQLSQRILTLPLGARMSSDDVSDVVANLAELMSLPKCGPD